MPSQRPYETRAIITWPRADHRHISVNERTNHDETKGCTRFSLCALRFALMRVVVDLELGRGFGYELADLPVSGFAVAITWDDHDGFLCWHGAEGRELLDYLLAHDEIVGFNLLRYDNTVLAGYLLPSEQHLLAQLREKTIDLHALLLHETGIRWSLDRIAQEVLGESKLPAPTGGDWQELAHYCERDVELTRDLDDVRRVLGVGDWG
jgi:hypothetical protein